MQQFLKFLATKYIIIIYSGNLGMIYTRALKLSFIRGPHFNKRECSRAALRELHDYYSTDSYKNKEPTVIFY